LLNAPPIWRHPFAPVEAAIFLSGPRLMLAPRLEVSVGPLRQEGAPRDLECGASGLERHGGTGAAFARSTAGLEAAIPLPLGCCAGVADAFRDRADLHVAVVDAPAFLRETAIASAGEGGHGPIISPIRPQTVHTAELKRLHGPLVRALMNRRVQAANILQPFCNLMQPN
jgi:hypothetical protein